MPTDEELYLWSLMPENLGKDPTGANIDIKSVDEDIAVKKSMAAVQRNRDTTFRRFIPKDKRFKGEGAPPYRIIKFYQDKNDRHYEIDYISSESPLLRSGQLTEWTGYKLGLEWRSFTKPNVVFAVNGQKAYFQNFKALEQITEMLYYPKFNWKGILNSIGQAAQVVSPLLNFVPGVGSIASGILGGVGKNLAYATKY